MESESLAVIQYLYFVPSDSGRSGNLAHFPKRGSVNKSFLNHLQFTHNTGFNAVVVTSHAIIMNRNILGYD